MLPAAFPVSSVAQMSLYRGALTQSHVSTRLARIRMTSYTMFHSEPQHIYVVVHSGRALYWISEAVKMCIVHVFVLLQARWNHGSGLAPLYFIPPRWNHSSGLAHLYFLQMWTLGYLSKWFTGLILRRQKTLLPTLVWILLTGSRVYYTKRVHTRILWANVCLFEQSCPK